MTPHGPADIGSDPAVGDRVGLAIRAQVFADHGSRGSRRYAPDGGPWTQSCSWRGMCLQSPRPDGSDHVFADGTDLLDELLTGPLRPAEEVDRLVRQVLGGVAPGPDDAAIADSDGWFAQLARHGGVELTWATFRQRVAVGRVDEAVGDHRRLSTVEVVDPAEPGCREVVAWDDADVAAARDRVERAVVSVRELAALPIAALPDAPVDVVLEPGRAGPLFHELVGHPLEADIVAAGSSYLCGRDGERVAPAWLRVSDGPAPAGEGLSAAVDDEGTPLRPVMLIEAGRVAGLLCDGLSGAPLGLPGNGHGRRLDYRHPLIPRMWHTRATAFGLAPQEPAGTLRLSPRGLRLRWMNVLTGEAEFVVEQAVLDAGDHRPHRVGRCVLSLRAGVVLSALRPGDGEVRGAGRATKGCGKLGQFPVVTTFANSGLWIPGEAVDVRSDAA